MYLEEIGINGPEWTLDINEAKILDTKLKLYTFCSALDSEGIEYSILAVS